MKFISKVLLIFSLILLISTIIIDARTPILVNNKKPKSNEKNSKDYLDTVICRFSKLFTADQLFNDTNSQVAFLKNVSFWEGQFHQNNVGLNNASGL